MELIQSGQPPSPEPLRSRWSPNNNQLERRKRQASECDLIRGHTWDHLQVRPGENITNEQKRDILHLNLLTLWERQGGERYWVDENTGLLQVYEGFSGTVSWYADKVKRLFTKRDNPTRTDNKVKSVITEVLKSLEGAGYKERDHVALKSFFTKKMKGLRDKVYDRSQIPENIINLIKPDSLKSAEEAIDPPPSLIALGEGAEPIRQRTRQQKLEDYCSNINEYRLRVEEVKFAQSLGVDLVKNDQGTSGNYIGRDWRGKKRLLFKPHDEGPDSAMNPHLVSKLKNFFWGLIPYYSRRTCYYPDQNHINEVAASRLAREIGLNVIPVTEMETFKSTAFNSGTHKVEKKGSCQVWVEPDPSERERIEEAYQAFHLFNPKWLPIQIPLFVQTWLMRQTWLRDYAPSIWKLFNLDEKRELIFNALPQRLFELLAIVHILTGNGDGHPANYLLLRQSPALSGIDETIKIFLIDFGWSMPHMHPLDALALRFLYDFRYLPQAESAFSADGRVIIERIRDRAQEIISRIGRFIDDNQGVKPNAIRSLDIEDNHSAVDYNKQIKMMEERLQPLLWGIANNIPIREIAKIRSPEDYVAFFVSRLREGNGQYVPQWRLEEIQAVAARQR